MASSTAPQTSKCLRCGRTLTSAASIARGYGRTCGAHIRHAAATAEGKPEQLAKATELIEQGGIVPTSRPALYLAVSSDGAVTYLVDQIEQSCTCRAGQRSLRCYHLIAADLVNAPAHRAAA